jgi:hypothetical protein
VWRALFLALGINAIILGTECLLLDRVELAPSIAGQSVAESTFAGGTGLFQNSVYQYQPPASGLRAKTFKPREWMPWSLIAAGILTVVYTSAYVRRKTAPAA